MRGHSHTKKLPSTGAFGLRLDSCVVAGFPGVDSFFFLRCFPVDGKEV